MSPNRLEIYNYLLYIDSAKLKPRRGTCFINITKYNDDANCANSLVILDLTEDYIWVNEVCNYRHNAINCVVEETI